VFDLVSAVGVFQIDERGELINFSPFSSDDEAVLKIGELKEVNLQAYKTYFGRQRELLEEAGFSDSSYFEALRRIAIKLAEEQLSKSYRAEDLLISAVEALEDIHKALNLLASRLATTVTMGGIKVELDEGEVDYRRILDAGAGVSSPLVMGLSTQIENLIVYKDSLEKEIEDLMMALSPNLLGLAGPLLGAKLISMAKGLERLASMPSSRIQVLGAERAMFRHLRERGKPPKHGLIFQHPTISRSPWWMRGKIARSLAAKIAIAARLDAYSDQDLSASLKEDFMKRVQTVRKTFSEEPKKMRIIRTPRKSKKRRGR
jgi:nucleolar protein 56